MPVVAQFDGIKIEFYFDDHAPPHFHARYAEHIVAIEIKTLRVKQGCLPPKQSPQTLDWAASLQDELLRAWYQCRMKDYPGEIR